jgi:hypothetical protein
MVLVSSTQMTYNNCTLSQAYEYTFVFLPGLIQRVFTYFLILLFDVL